MYNFIEKMDSNIEELADNIGKLIQEELNPATTGNQIDALIERTGYSKQFVRYIVESVSLHYRDIKIIEHMVRFVANKCSRFTPPIDATSNNISPNLYTKQIKPICNTLKEDTAFGLDLDDDEFVGDNFSAQEYPLLTRFAIIATYCASYNPQTTDQRFFFKGRDILRRKFKAGSAKKLREKEKCHETGARSFEHQRAMFIFLYFCKTFDENFKCFINDTDLQIEFTSQIYQLVNFGLLKIVTAHENFDMPMYISLCNLDFVKQIANSISSGLNLEREFLYDFAPE